MLTIICAMLCASLSARAGEAMIPTPDGAGASAFASFEVEGRLVKPDHVWALVIGISDYDGVRGFEFARADAELLTYFLVHGLWSERQPLR
jgi:hypothetical protein